MMLILVMFWLFRMPSLSADWAGLGFGVLFEGLVMVVGAGVAILLWLLVLHLARLAYVSPPMVGKELGVRGGFWRGGAPIGSATKSWRHIPVVEVDQLVGVVCLADLTGTCCQVRLSMGRRPLWMVFLAGASA